LRCYIKENAGIGGGFQAPQRLSHHRLGREPGAVSGMQRGALEGKGRQVHELASAIRVPRLKAA
jgi:hypothetical protein